MHVDMAHDTGLCESHVHAGPARTPSACCAGNLDQASHPAQSRDIQEQGSIKIQPCFISQKSTVEDLRNFTPFAGRTVHGSLHWAGRLRSNARHEERKA